MKKPDPITLRVYYEDTDAGALVYHAGYIRFAGRARHEWLRNVLGDDMPVAGEGEGFMVVRHLDVEFLKPAKLDDILSVDARLTHIGNSSIQMEHTVSREGEDLVKLHFVLVAVGQDGKIMDLPTRWVEKFTPLLEQK